jgi:hypothetical protein
VLELASCDLEKFKDENQFMAAAYRLSKGLDPLLVECQRNNHSLIK